MLMAIANLCRRFRKDESGAVTVDWVALTAGIVLVGMIVVFYIMNEGVNPLAEGIVTSLSGASDNLADIGANGYTAPGGAE